MLCSINDYFLADGTLTGGYGLTGLRLKMQRIFDKVIPISQTSGFLITGAIYRIIEFHTGDDFTNVGGTNVTGSVFVATSEAPSSWAFKSILGNLSPVLFDRAKRRVDISFRVQRVHSTITDADVFCLDHELTVPRDGDIKLITSGTETVIALIVNGSLVQHELTRQIGKFTEHAYTVIGSPIFAPTPGEDHIITEDGDRITTEDGDALIVE